MTIPGKSSPKPGAIGGTEINGLSPGNAATINNRTNYMSDTWMIFGLAVGLAVAWVFAISLLIEPAMEESHWGGDPDSKSSKSKE